jgi:hypothetical protein
MKTRYKLIGISKLAESDLCEEDIQQLTEIIGCEINESESNSMVDGKRMFIIPSGEEVHVDFLEIEEVQPELPFEISQKN